MLLYLFFDSLLSKKKMTTEKWPKAADSPLYIFRMYMLFIRRMNLYEKLQLKGPD